MQDLSYGSLDMTASQLFNAVDVDGDGMISLPEFEKLHSALGTATAAQEHKRAYEARGRKVAVKISVALCALLVLMLAGNAGLTAAVIVMSKETKVDAGMSLILSRERHRASPVKGLAVARGLDPLSTSCLHLP